MREWVPPIRFEVDGLPSTSDPAVALVLLNRCPKLLVPTILLAVRFGFGWPDKGVGHPLLLW